MNTVAAVLLQSSSPRVRLGAIIVAYPCQKHKIDIAHFYIFVLDSRLRVLYLGFLGRHARLMLTLRTTISICVLEVCAERNGNTPNNTEPSQLFITAAYAFDDSFHTTPHRIRTLLCTSR